MTDDIGGPAADTVAVLDLLPAELAARGGLAVLGELGGSSRSVVHRVRAGDGTVVVKRFTGDAYGFPREAAALSVLPPAAPGPRLLAVRENPPTVVLSDAGSGPSVADVLLGGDPAAAREGLLSWASAVARLHNCTADRGAAFRSALAGRTDQPVSLVPERIESAAGAIEAQCLDLGVPVPAGAWDGLRGLYAGLAGGPAVLSPGDICPDNNVLTSGGRVLIDFEGAQWWHPAWDVAYLVVPWPTCWCAWRLPEKVSEEAIRRYRETSALPWAGSADFRPDVEAAAAVWAIVTTAELLGRVMAEDPPPANPAKRRPALRALILNRLAAAEAYRSARHSSGALCVLAGDLRTALLARWGDLPVPYAPAFAGTAP